MNKKIIAEKMAHTHRAVIYIIHHASTLLNSEDKIRGWLDLPLDENGIEEAHRLGKDLAKLHLNGLLSSDMKRAKQTAEIISKEARIPIMGIVDDFRPWDVGIHQGKLAEKVLPEMERYARETPGKALPEGESFNTFKNRFLNAIRETQEQFKGTKIGVVTHHRGDRLMAAWEKKGMKPDKELDLDIMFQKGIPPGQWRKQGTKIETGNKPD